MSLFFSLHVHAAIHLDDLSANITAHVAGEEGCHIDVVVKCLLVKKIALLRLHRRVTDHTCSASDEGDRLVTAVLEMLQDHEEVELDLVEIVANAEPPVCKIMDFNKHLFDLKQKQKDAKKKQHQVQVKEIKLRPGTDVGDYNIKLRAILRFLEEGNKVKITLRFRGREMAHQQLGLAQLQKVEADVLDFQSL